MTGSEFLTFVMEQTTFDSTTFRINLSNLAPISLLFHLPPHYFMALRLLSLNFPLIDTRHSIRPFLLLFLSTPLKLLFLLLPELLFYSIIRDRSSPL